MGSDISSPSSSSSPKILVTGTKYSGKSTLCRNLALVSGTLTITDDSRKLHYARLIRLALVKSMAFICWNSRLYESTLRISSVHPGTYEKFLVTEETKERREYFLKMIKHREYVDEEVLAMLEAIPVPEMESKYDDYLMDIMVQLWQDPAIQAIHSSSYDGVLTRRFFECISLIGSEEYLPTDQEILEAYLQNFETTSISTRIAGRTIELLDHGTDEKLMEVDKDVRAVVFVLSLKRHSLKDRQCPSRTNMESFLLKLKEFCEIFSVKELPVIVVLNKKDLFDVEGFTSDSLEIVKSRVQESTKTLKRPVHILVVAATDTRSIETLLKQVDSIDF